MIIRQPSAREDRPAITSTSIVGAVCLGTGLWVAHATMAHPVPVPSAAESVEFAGAPSDVEVVDEPEPQTEPEPETEIEPEPEPATEPEVEIPTTTTPTTTTTATTTTPPPAPLPRRPGPITRVRHGRVAYLRCDGAPQAPGPFPCPRDAALEAMVWAAIDQTLDCDPALPPGQADLVVEWDREAGASAPMITTRDTFPDEAIRTDAAALLACVSPSLSSATTIITGDRLRVGFRFELE